MAVPLIRISSDRIDHKLAWVNMQLNNKEAAGHFITR